MTVMDEFQQPKAPGPSASAPPSGEATEGGAPADVEYPPTWRHTLASSLPGVQQTRAAVAIAWVQHCPLGGRAAMPSDVDAPRVWTAIVYA
jgi:hypothetical protein